MKTARERAMDAAAVAGLSPSDGCYLPFVDAAELAFEEHGRDHRALIEDAVKNALHSHAFAARIAARGAVRGAPQPGEAP